MCDILNSLSFTGPVFGNMDNFTGLGVFVDTYPNEEKHLEVRSNQTAYFTCEAKELTTHDQIVRAGPSRTKPYATF